MKNFGVLIITSVFFIQCVGFPARTGGVVETAQVEETVEDTQDEEETPEENFYINISRPGTDIPVNEFSEIWAYVIAGRENALSKGLPLTDIGYFGAEVDSYGKLTDVPRRQNITFQARIHLVVACNSRSLTHFVLMPGRPERQALIADLISSAANYDGLQIDFEYVPARDGEAYLSFLKELRERLPKNKALTVALAARSRKVADDVYEYEKILPIVDRILVMAYDEHWSGSSPGSVASLAWCGRVAEYALRVIGGEKLVMGVPFYGRAWGDYSPSRALIYNTIATIVNDERVTDIKYESGIPTFSYNKNVSIKVYYEDEYSLSSRMEMYKSMGVKSVGFWRLGQETSEIWKYLKLKK